MKKLKMEDKIYGLTTIYSEVKYNFGMFNRKNIDLEEEYKISLKSILKIDNIYDYYNELKRFISLLDDCHTYVSYPTELLESSEFGILPINIVFIENGLYINYYPKKYKKILSPYCKILKVNGIQVEEYFKKNVYPFVSSASYKSIIAKNVFEIGRISDKISLEVEHFDKSLSNVTLERHMINDSNYNYYDDLNFAKSPYYSHKATSLYLSNEKSFELLEYKNIGIISVWSFNKVGLAEEMIRHIKPLISKEKIIIDLRNNTGGNDLHALEFLSLFTDKEYFETLDKTRIHDAHKKARAAIKINWNQCKTYEEYVQKYGDDDKSFESCYKNYYNQDHEIIKDKHTLSKKYLDIFNQPIVLLFGRNTVSAAETFVQGFKYLNLGITIGENTPGSGGQPLIVDLPFGGVVGIAIDDSVNLDETPVNNVGFSPDIEVKYQIQDYLPIEENMIDKEFEEAIKILNKE